MPYPAYFVENEPGERQEHETQLLKEHQRIRKGRYYERRFMNPRWRPNRYAFRGQVLLLVGPQVASAGSLFASMVRSDKRSIVIGEETSGGTMATLVIFRFVTDCPIRGLS